MFFLSITILSAWPQFPTTMSFVLLVRQQVHHLLLGRRQKGREERRKGEEMEKEGNWHKTRKIERERQGKRTGSGNAGQT